MVADNGPLSADVDIIIYFLNLPFSATIVIYHINNVYTVFLIKFYTFKDNLFIWNHSETVAMPELATLISESRFLCDKI